MWAETCTCTFHVWLKLQQINLLVRKRHGWRFILKSMPLLFAQLFHQINSNDLSIWYCINLGRLVLVLHNKHVKSKWFVYVDDSVLKVIGQKLTTAWELCGIRIPILVYPILCKLNVCKSKTLIVRSLNNFDQSLMSAHYMLHQL